MSHKPKSNSTKRIEKRFQRFLDCLARMLAKRWIADMPAEDEQAEDRKKTANDATV